MYYLKTTSLTVAFIAMNDKDVYKHEIKENHILLTHKLMLLKK